MSSTLGEGGPGRSGLVTGNLLELRVGGDAEVVACSRGARLAPQEAEAECRFQEAWL